VVSLGRGVKVDSALGKKSTDCGRVEAYLPDSIPDIRVDIVEIISDCNGKKIVQIGR